MARRLAARFQQRSVAETIAHLHQCRQQRLISGIARNKQQRMRRAEPLRQLLFQRLMRGAKAGDVAGATAAHTILSRPLLPGGDHLCILAQAQIVVAGKIQIMFTAKLNLASITASIHLPLAVCRALLSLIQCPVLA